jgi:hypothetical protein
MLLLFDIADISTLAAGLLEEKSSRTLLLACKGNDLQTLIDLFHSVRIHFCPIVVDYINSQLYKLLDYSNSDLGLRRMFLRTLVRLCKTSGLYPNCLVLPGMELHFKEPQAAGRFGDVWREEVDGHIIAIKVARTYVRSDADKIAKVQSRTTLQVKASCSI